MQSITTSLGAVERLSTLSARWNPRIISGSTEERLTTPMANEPFYTPNRKPEPLVAPDEMSCFSRE
jgi:hypothetical protein